MCDPRINGGTRVRPSRISTEPDPIGRAASPGGRTMSGSANRREFLRTTSSLGAGLWVVGSGSDLFARSANETVNVACIGVGGQGGSNLNNVSRVKIGGKDAVNVVAL